MARGNDEIPSWMTVLKDPPASTEDPLLAWVRKIGRGVADSQYTDFIRDVGAGAAGGAAQYAVTQDLGPDKEAAGRIIGGAVSNAVQDVFKRVVDKMRGKSASRPTEAQVREMIEAKTQRDERVRQLMRTYGVPGY